MKKYIINKTGEDSASYTTFKNPNEELKAEIASFDPKLTELNMGWPPTAWTIGEKDGDDYKCTSGRDVKYFPITEVEESILEQTEKARNDKYLAYKHFKDAFGVLSYIQNDDTLYILDLTDAMKYGERIPDTMSVQSYFTHFTYELDTYDCLSLTFNAYGSTMCLYFTPEGDYINRDYNLDLSYYDQEIISPIIMLDKLKKMIGDKVGTTTEFEYSNDKYYTDNYCIIPYNNTEDNDFGVIIAPDRDDNKTYQVRRGDTIFKRPKKFKLKTFEDLWNTIIEQLTPIQKCLLSDDFMNYKNYINK